MEEAMKDQELAAIRARVKLARESWPAGSPRPGPMTDREALLAHIDAQSAEVARLTHALADQSEQDRGALEGLREERDVWQREYEQLKADSVDEHHIQSAEVARLREEVEALRRLKAAVEDEALKESVGDRHWADDPVDVLDAYRARLRAAIEAKT